MGTEIAFTFDTTGSMAPCLRQVRGNLDSALAPLFKEIPDLKIAIGAHGDYCDRHNYVTKWQDLTSDLYKLTQFVQTTPSTGGGDADECYELVLHEARSLNWSVNSRKILVVIGDALPHSVSYPQNTKRLDWRVEANALKDLGVQIYSVQCLPRSYNAGFYKEIAAATGGYHLVLDQFQDVVELIKAVVVRQQGNEQFKQYEQKVFDSGKMNRSLDKTFSILSGRKTSEKYDVSTPGLVPVPAGRFQVLRVDRDIDIKGFVEENDLPFKLGRGFYQFTKTEEIQEKKEVVLRDKFTGDMFTGNEARYMIGVPFGTRGRLRPADLGKYDIYVQSTSVNRKLKAKTGFLYEVDYER